MNILKFFFIFYQLKILKFWKDFANSGNPQLYYLFDKDIIALFIDFMLESESPLAGSKEKKSSMGNNYY